MYKNILVHSLVNLGDVVLATSAVALLKKAYPDAKVTMMVRPVATEIVKNNPIIDDVIIYDYKAKHRSFGQMLAMIKLISEKKFDIVISLDRKLRPALLTALAGIPVRVVPDKIFDNKLSHVTKLYNKVIHIKHDVASTHQSENYQVVIRGLTGIDECCKPVIGKMTEENENTADRLLQLMPAPKNYIALCVKGTFALKNWPKERFVELLDSLAEKYDPAFFIIGAPEDRSYAEEIIKKTKAQVANFCGETRLLDLVALFNKANLFITVDTGAMHIAATTNIPIVAMFGCTTPQRWHPLSNRSRVIFKNKHCCPCSIPEDACPEHSCLQEVSVDEVKAVVEEIENMWSC